MEEILAKDDPILVTGAAGFIGREVVGRLLQLGFTRIRCFVRPSSDSTKLQTNISRHGGDRRVELISGNLLSRDDCERAAAGAVVVYHLAAAAGKVVSKRIHELRHYYAQFVGRSSQTRQLPPIR